MKLARFRDVSFHRDMIPCAGTKDGHPCRARINPRRNESGLCYACRGRTTLEALRANPPHRDKIVAKLRKKLDPGCPFDEHGRVVQ